MKPTTFMKLSSSILLSAALTGCFLDDNDDNSFQVFDDITVIQSSGDGSTVEFTDGKSIVESDFLPQTATDYAVFANGEYFYQLGKFDIDTIQKYHIENPEMGYYANDGYSLRAAGETTSANPHNIVFLKDENNTAVITRYGNTKSWVVNLNAQSSDDFIIKELDLSHHTSPVTDTDKDPEASMAFISNAKLFITLQNLDGYTATNNAMVAVFDTTTWEEIDTDDNIDGIQGISLTLKNHQVGAANGDNIYLGSLVYGAWGTDEPATGGIEVINTSTLESSVATDKIAVSNITVTNQGNVFFVGYTGWEDNSLYALNSDNSYNTVGTEFSGINITMLASPGDSIWLGTNSFDGNNDEENDNQILRLDSNLDYTATNSFDDIVLSSVITALKPISIAFLDTDPSELSDSEE